MMMKKAKNHRKRHVPPGPCGIWYQAQKQFSMEGGGNGANSINSFGGIGGGAGSGGSSSHALSSQARRNLYRFQDDKDDDDDDNTKLNINFSMAWTAMQRSLDIATPYLSPHMLNNSHTRHDDLKKRYDLIRPHVPSNYVLLWEILNGDYDLTINDPKRVLVLVHSVESHIHHNIWTVQLQDDTGATIRAWLEPKFVQEQMQIRNRETFSSIRPGVVWMLRRVGMIVVPNEDDEEKIDRLLLISGNQIERIWTPEESKPKNSEEQERNKQWIERRRAIPTLGENGDDVGPNEPPEDDDVEEAHRPNHNRQQHEIERNEIDEEAELDSFSRDAIRTDAVGLSHGGGSLSMGRTQGHQEQVEWGAPVGRNQTQQSQYSNRKSGPLSQPTRLATQENQHTASLDSSQATYRLATQEHQNGGLSSSRASTIGNHGSQSEEASYLTAQLTRLATQESQNGVGMPRQRQKGRDKAGQSFLSQSTRLIASQQSTSQSSPSETQPLASEGSSDNQKGENRATTHTDANVSVNDDNLSNAPMENNSRKRIAVLTASNEIRKRKKQRQESFTKNKSFSAIWMVNDPSVLELFDEDEEEDHQGKEHSILDAGMAPDNRNDDAPVHVNDDNKKFLGANVTAGRCKNISIFEVSKWREVDLSALSEEE